jgi:hypothetical protein
MQNWRAIGRREGCLKGVRFILCPFLLFSQCYGTIPAL